MEPKDSLLHLQVPASCPCPESDQSVHAPPSSILKIHLNIILPSMPGSSKWTLSLRFSHQNPVCIFPQPHTFYMLCQSQFSQFDHPKKYLVCSTDHSAPHYTVFSTLLLTCPSWAQILSSAPYSQTPSDNNTIHYWKCVYKNPTYLASCHHQGLMSTK